MPERKTLFVYINQQNSLGLSVRGMAIHKMRLIVKGLVSKKDPDLIV